MKFLRFASGRSGTSRRCAGARGTIPEFFIYPRESLFLATLPNLSAFLPPRVSVLIIYRRKRTTRSGPWTFSRSIPGGLSSSFDFSKDSCIVFIEAYFFSSNPRILFFFIHPTRRLLRDGFSKFVIRYIVIFTL